MHSAIIKGPSVQFMHATIDAKVSDAFPTYCSPLIVESFFATAMGNSCSTRLTRRALVFNPCSQLIAPQWWWSALWPKQWGNWIMTSLLMWPCFRIVGGCDPRYNKRVQTTFHLTLTFHKQWLSKGYYPEFLRVSFLRVSSFHISTLISSYIVMSQFINKY